MATKQKKETKKQLRTKQDNALLATFIILVVLVIGLTIVAINMKNLKNSNKSNITIPVLEENSESEISVDISDMSNGDTKEYIFKVTNFKDKEILEKNITYDIAITPTESTKIKLYKNDSDKNLLSADDLLVEDNKFEKNNKSSDEYHLIIEATSKPSSKEVITIKINS